MSDKPRLTGIIQRMKSSETATRCDRALILLLDRWFEEIPEFEDGESFHRMFRQLDVVDEQAGGQMDMAIWNLIHESALFWHCIPRDTEEVQL